MTMTPSNAWDTYMGDISPIEFAEQCQGAHPADLIEDYVAESPMCADLDSEQRSDVASALRQYLDLRLPIDCGPGPEKGRS